MLPDSLRSSYAQYKDDTDRFATWLLRAAEKCGYQSSRLLAGDPANSNNGTANAKGQVKSKAKSAPVLPLKYKATVSELRTIGQVVAKSSLKAPTAILAVARRAVTLRKDAASWFTGKGDAASNKRHAYFVEVLEEICESLEWRTNGTSKEDSAARSATAALADAATGAKTPDEAWVNQFATLTVEEPEEIPEPSDSSKQLVQVELVEDVGDDAEEQAWKHLSHAYFQAFCLFRDLHNMRAFIRQTWEDYRDNKLDIMTASVVTDTAMQLARGAAEELVHLPSVSPEELSDEIQTQSMLYNMACVARGHNEPSSTELGLTFNVKMADEAEWCFIPTSTVLQSFVPLMQKLDNLPDFKKWHWGKYNPKADRSRMSVAERFNEDKILLLEILPEFCLIQEMGGKWPVRDEFTHGFCEFAKTKKVTLWLCFAAQVLLDIHHTVRSSPAGPWNDLRMAGLRASKTIADFKKLSATHPKPAFWPEEGDREIDGIQHVIDSTTKFDPQHAVWKLVSPNPTREEFDFLKNHPVLCGLLAFHVNLRMQVIGQSLVNQWYDVQQMAFLYNLVNTVPEAKLAWPDIEAFINIHGENRIFVGDRPKDASESLNRLETATGISSITRFARDSRRNNNPFHRPDMKQARLLKPTTTVANLFRDSYTKAAQTRNIANAEIGRLLDELAGASPDAKQGTKRGKKNQVIKKPETLLLEKWSNKHSLGALQFLALVRTRLHEEEPVLMFNYFGMHQRSIEMLRRIREKEHHKFAQYFTPGYMPDESMISNLVILIHHVARGSAASSQALGIAQGPNTQAVSRFVMSCGGVMRGYLRAKGDVACKELRAFCKNKTPLYVGEAVPEEDEEAQKQFVYWFGLEEVIDPRAMASLMTGIPVS